MLGGSQGYLPVIPVRQCCRKVSLDRNNGVKLQFQAQGNLHEAMVRDCDPGRSQVRGEKEATLDLMVTIISPQIAPRGRNLPLSLD